MNIELSQGSHFFHNLNSFNVFYFSLPYGGKYDIDWEWLGKQKVQNELTFLIHLRLDSNLKIEVDGRNGRGIILKP